MASQPRNVATALGLMTRYRATVAWSPTQTVTPSGRAAKASSSVRSSPRKNGTASGPAWCSNNRVAAEPLFQPAVARISLPFNPWWKCSSGNPAAAASTATRMSDRVATLAVLVADTLEKVDADNRINDTVFRWDWLVEAYAKRHQLTANITDVKFLVECGRNLFVVPCSAQSFEITTRENLTHAEAELWGRALNAEGPAARGFGDEAEW